MGSFTAQQIENLMQASLDFHWSKNTIFSQTIQEKPLLKALNAKKKTAPGGKENITVRVKGQYGTTIQGFENDDTVSYGNPGFLKTAKYPWKLIHFGISVPHHELIANGISVVKNGQTVEHGKRDLVALANIFDDKVEDMMEGGERGMNEMYWKDGAQDSKVVPGLQSFILDDPTSATIVGGLDQSVNTWWRNRASLGLNAGTPSNLVLSRTMQQEFRQLRRYGKPKHLMLCGSDWMDAVEQELRSKGDFTNRGWANSTSKTIDLSVDDPSFKGVTMEYDPTLDDMSKAKYCYVLDMNVIYPMPIDGEDMKDHSPERPAEKYVLYKAKTWVGGLVCRQRNTSGVYSIA